MWTEDVPFVETQRQHNHEEFYDTVAVFAPCKEDVDLVEFK